MPFLLVRRPTLAIVMLLCALAATPAAAQSLVPVEPPKKAKEVSEPNPTAQREQALAELRRMAAPIETLNRQIKRVARFARPSVVHIEAHKFSGQRVIDEAGSGVLIEIAGETYVLTNRHVIKDAPPSRIELKLDDGQELRPAAVWADRETDVAVMQLPSGNYVHARFGDSDKVEVGDFVLAVGSPFGLSHSITFGIISAKGRRDLKLGNEGIRYQSFFQTDAAINPGNSGGPLLNLRGEVIGINTAIASSSGGNDGIGFSIPANIVTDIARQLVRTGTVTRAFLGVRLDADYNEIMAQRAGLDRLIGARISRIEPDSVAARSQLKVGDIIIEYDGVRIDDDRHLVNQVKLTPLGKEVPITVLRNRQPVKVRVQMARPTTAVQTISDER